MGHNQTCFHCAAFLGGNIPISQKEKKGICTKPLFIKKMPFKQIHHKAKERGVRPGGRGREDNSLAQEDGGVV